MLNKTEVNKALSEQMKQIGSGLSREQRKANGRKAWQTRRENLARKLAGGGK